jgi:predicted AAA+ superfamily ATPase
MIDLPKNIIKRAHYLNRVVPFMDKSIIKVFIGQRRVGKSYLLFQIIQHILEQDEQAKIIYINKEDLAFSTLKTALDLNEFVKTKKASTGKTYLFIDEIQDIVDFHLALRSLQLDEQMDILYRE